MQIGLLHQLVRVVPMIVLDVLNARKIHVINVVSLNSAVDAHVIGVGSLNDNAIVRKRRSVIFAKLQ
jgi:hypothetical protein